MCPWKLIQKGGDERVASWLVVGPFDLFAMLYFNEIWITVIARAKVYAFLKVVPKTYVGLFKLGISRESHPHVPFVDIEWALELWKLLQGSHDPVLFIDLRIMT